MADYALGDRGSVHVITNDYYDAEILQVFEELQIDRERIWNGEARLVPEPDNPYESHSIAVYIDDIKVGRLSPEDSAQYWKPITRVIASGYEAIVQMQLSAVLRRQNHEEYIESQGILSLSPPGSLFPLNQAPQQATLLPQGPSMKVLDEKDYSEYLHSILPPSGEGRLILSLEANQVRNADGTFTDIIEVFHDRKKVGRLSTQMSEQLVPIVRYAFEHNKLTSAWGTIRGTNFEVSLTVQAVRAHDLPQEWFAELPNNVPELLPDTDSFEVADAFVPTEGEKHRQHLAAGKKRRGLVGSLTPPPAPPTQESPAPVTSENKRSTSPTQRMTLLLGILGGLIFIVGVIVLFSRPMIGIVAIVLGTSILFLGIYMNRVTEENTESSYKS